MDAAPTDGPTSPGGRSRKGVCARMTSAIDAEEVRKEERIACAQAICRYCNGGVPTERDRRGRWYHVGRVQPGNLEMVFDCVAGPILERGWMG